MNELDEDIDGIVKYLANKAWLRYDKKYPFEDLLDMAYKGLHYTTKYYKEGKGRTYKSFATMVITQRIKTEVSRKKYSKHILNTVELEKTQFLPVFGEENKDLAAKESLEHFNWLLNNSTLTKDEKTSLTYRTAGYAFREVAETLSLSTERARQLVKQARVKVMRTHKKELRVC